MPELPEVSTMVDDLRRSVIGKKIKSVWSDLPPGKLPRLTGLCGATIKAVDRRGKNVLIYLEKTGQDSVLAVHPRMTGHFLIGRWRIPRSRKEKIKPLSADVFLNEKTNSYIHLVFVLSGGEMLALSDVRKFAKINLAAAGETETGGLEKLGPDALSPKLTLNKFVKAIGQRKKPIKSVLMDQKLLSGIGNIYSDEILWTAEIDPRRSAEGLSSGEIKRIYSAMRLLLLRAVRLRGTSFSDFRDARGRKGHYGDKRVVYGLFAYPCKRCGTPIAKTKIGGRTASFCPNCQK
ncbi:MAG: DNA-formamidopyrimidine glycosylase [Patescibacteria group bacterium]|nr:DNA-formamidopyrimidine glycosylase [Patescibacteria group bacterium]